MANVDQIKDKARGVVMGQIDQRTTDLGNVVGGHVQNLRSMSDSLRSQGQDGTARLVDTAAQRLDSLSSYLTSTDGERIVHDIEQIARTQPLATATVGLVAGLTAARLLKTAASQRYRTYGDDSSGEYASGSYSGGNYTSGGSRLNVDYDEDTTLGVR